MAILKKIFTFLIISALPLMIFAQDNHGQNTQHNSDGTHTHSDGTVHDNQHQPVAAPDHGKADKAHTNAAPQGHHGTENHGSGCGHNENEKFNPGAMAIHHISDANAIHIYGDLYFHLPVILWSKDNGMKFTTSAAFDSHHHGNGTKAIDRYVLRHGEVNRIHDTNFPSGEQAIECYVTHLEKNAKGKEVDVHYALAGGKEWLLEKKTSFDGGLMGGGITSYWDLSITRNVFTMLLTCFFLFFLLRRAAKAYTTREGLAPTGSQNFFEILVTFIRDEVARPLIGEHKYEKFLPYLLSAFFFILGLNLFGQLPFFPGSGNVTGSLSVTMVLAVITFLLTNLNGNAHYWGHTLWMPGVPAILKILIITPVEILGLFLKPFTLMLRLFANITAGHIVIISFVSIIFIFGKAGAHTDGEVLGSSIGALISVPLTLFMMAMELLVAFLQAFIFTMLSAVYIGTAVEDAHH